MVWKIAIKSSKLKPGKKKMLTIGKKMILVGRFEEGDEYYATEALCRPMRWPPAYGGKVKDDFIKCPLQQTTHNIETGELIEWSPFPIYPPYGKMVGKFSKQKDLKIYETRVKDGNIEINIPES